MKKSIVLSMLFASAVLMSHCAQDTDIEPSLYGNGVFIVNEGPFGSGTGSISFFDRASGNVEQSIFSRANNRPLGNIVQSINFHDGKGYIVVNNANKVEVVEESSFKSLATIENLPFPRFFLGIDDEKAYVSCWGGDQGEIKVIDLRNYTVTKSIPVGIGPDAMVRIGDQVFVANGGGFGSDNRISVIDIENDETVNTLILDDNPNSMQPDGQNNLWILCSGKKTYDPNTFEIIPEESSKGALLKIDPTDYEILERFEFDNIFDSPSKLVTNEAGNAFFYLLGFGAFRFDIADNQLPGQPLIGASFYGLGYDPVSDYIYAADPGNYSANGKVIRYETESGAPIDTFSVGIIPNGFYFN